jgi:hypothetical protein
MKEAVQSPVLTQDVSIEMVKSMQTSTSFHEFAMIQ